METVSNGSRIIDLQSIKSGSMVFLEILPHGHWWVFSRNVKISQFFIFVYMLIIIINEIDELTIFFSKACLWGGDGDGDSSPTWDQLSLEQRRQFQMKQLQKRLWLRKSDGVMQMQQHQKQSLICKFNYIMKVG